MNQKASSTACEDVASGETRRAADMASLKFLLQYEFAWLLSPSKSPKQLQFARDDPTMYFTKFQCVSHDGAANVNIDKAEAPGDVH